MESTEDAAMQERLERQLNLLPSAHISTLHSFCQWVIRSYFYKLDINPTARIGNEAEMALLQQEVLADLLTKSYEEGLYNCLLYTSLEAVVVERVHIYLI